MPYVGKTPTVGNFVKLDAITTSATTTFNLLNGGVAYSPQSPNHCIVSLNGVIQSPTSAYTISGSTIVFSDALTSSDTIDFILVLGDVLNIGTPSDNTVSLAKLTATGTKDATTFLRGDNTFATAGATAGTIIQVVTATDSTPRSTTSTSFVTGSNTLSVSITPASTSNKILLFCDVSYVYNNAGDTHVTIYRNSTNLGSNTGIKLANDSLYPMTLSWYDTPSSTSSLTYQVYFKATAGTSNINYFLGRTGTWTNSIIAMEVKG